MAGCSVDPLEAQEAFAKKFELRFPLIADTDAAVAKAYDVYRDDWKVAGRATAVIGRDGVVLKTYPRASLDGKGHAEQVLADVRKLLGAG